MARSRTLSVGVALVLGCCIGALSCYFVLDAVYTTKFLSQAEAGQVPPTDERLHIKRKGKFLDVPDFVASILLDNSTPEEQLPKRREDLTRALGNLFFSEDLLADSKNNIYIKTELGEKLFKDAQKRVERRIIASHEIVEHYNEHKDVYTASQGTIHMQGYWWAPGELDESYRPRREWAHNPKEFAETMHEKRMAIADGALDFKELRLSLVSVLGFAIAAAVTPTIVGPNTLQDGTLYMLKLWGYKPGKQLSINEAANQIKEAIKADRVHQLRQKFHKQRLQRSDVELSPYIIEQLGLQND